MRVDSRPLHNLALAITQLTVVPLPVQWPADRRPDVASYYVWAGFLVGLIAYVPLKAMELSGVAIHSHAALLAALILVEWAAFTRLIHWDGLADVADGWFGRDESARRLAASDTHVGAFGVSVVALTVVVQYSALSTILQNHEMTVLLVPAFSRAAATFGAWLGKPAKPTGLGAAVTGHPSRFGLVFGILGILATCGLMVAGHHLHGVLAAAIALAVAATVPHVVSRRFGGVTGDVLGAAIMITESIIMVVFAVIG